jgi:hypothetical protein
MRLMIVFAICIFASCCVPRVEEEEGDGKDTVRVSEELLPKEPGWIYYSGVHDSTFCLTKCLSSKSILCFYPLSSTKVYCDDRTLQIIYVDAEKLVFRKVESDSIVKE